MLHDCPTAKVTFYDITIGRISTAAGPAEEMMMRADWKNALTNQVQHKYGTCSNQLHTHWRFQLILEEMTMRADWKSADKPNIRHNIPLLHQLKSTSPRFEI